MKQLLVLSALVIVLIGCGGGAAPAPISLREIPAALQKAFQSAKEDMRLLPDGLEPQRLVVFGDGFIEFSLPVQGVAEKEMCLIGRRISRS